MMLNLALVSLMAGSAAATAISVTSEAGSALMSMARRLGNDDNNVDYSWMAGYNLKFEHCVNMPNFERQGMRNQALIKFRLCPAADENGDAASCSSTCNGPQYVVEGKQFLYYIATAKCTAVATSCENFCYNNVGDYYDDDACTEACYATAGMSDCVNLDADGDGDKAYECRNEYGDSEDGNNNEEEYYAFGYHMGAYCAEGGDAVYMGTFSDNGCTELAEDGTYSTYYGASQPFSSTPIISNYEDCLSCKDSDTSTAYYNYTIDACSAIYSESGKCEKEYVPSGVTYPDTSACKFISNYLPSLKKVMNSNTSSKSKYSSSSTGGGGAAPVFAWLFFISTCGLAGYIFMGLKKRKVALSAESIGSFA
jgi:hypothetical protein